VERLLIKRGAKVADQGGNFEVFFVLWPDSRSRVYRSPITVERPRRRSSPESPESPLPSPPMASRDEALTSTTPPEMGRGKGKKPHTARYTKSKELGDIAESQEAHKAGRRD
jgi:hypothetical protein